MLRICNTIKKEELDKLIKYFSIDDIKKAYLKARWWIWNNIWKVDNWVILRKIYLTSEKCSWRLLFLFFISKNIFIPVVLRLKNDKLIWNNLSMNNKNFVSLLDKNFDIVKKDLLDKNYIDFTE